jgi:fructosamine-3-kinase
MSAFRKQAGSVPPRYFAWEAAGLRWLAAAGGARIVEVLDAGEQHLDLVRLDPTGPTPRAAEELGRALAVTHDAGAPAYGSGPEGWDGDGFFGPLEQPLPMVLGTWQTWGEFYAEARLAPLVRRCRDARLLDERATAVLDRVCRRLEDGDLDTDDRPARIHGDLWSGNVLWTAEGAVLIDPAAHGGHRETDLALLALFGAPHLDRVRAGYEAARPLADGWRDRVWLHQLHCLLVHVAVYGGGYVHQTLDAAQRYV